MLELSNVFAGYGAGDVLESISFKLSAGERLGILGANGCGKSTLLRLIAGLMPYRGNALLCGVQIKKLPRKILAKNIAMLTQIPPPTYSFTVYDTVMMGRFVHIASLLGSLSSHDREAVENALEAVNMQDMRHRLITQLSGGQLQRVFLARTLAQESEIILLDEPTNHLDLRYQLELIDYLGILKKTIIGVMHDINHARRLCERLLVLKEGKMLHDGNLCEEALVDAFDVDVGRYMRETYGVWIKKS